MPSQAAIQALINTRNSQNTSMDFASKFWAGNTQRLMHGSTCTGKTLSPRALRKGLRGWDFTLGVVFRLEAISPFLVLAT
jgi:hypothetical protein